MRTRQYKLEIDYSWLAWKLRIQSKGHSFTCTIFSSCFQLSRHGSVLLPNDMQAIMDSSEVKQALLETYAKYSVSIIDSCSVKRVLSAASFVTTPGPWLVVLAAVIGILSLVATCTACCLARR